MIEKGKLYSHLYKLNKEANSPIKLEFIENHSEYEYGSESEDFFYFKLGDNEYRVGYWTTIEDAEDWAQAESYNGDIFIKNESHVSENEIIEDVVNYLQIERDSKLTKLLK